MFSLVYGSSAVRPFSDDDLIALLAHCRKRNAEVDVTGILLYADGNFLQVLEGPKEGVEKIFNKIIQDNRHRGVLRLLEREVEQREFPDWAMAFRNLSDPAVQGLPGYSEFLNGAFSSRQFQPDQTHVRYLLEMFRQNLAR